MFFFATRKNLRIFPSCFFTGKELPQVCFAAVTEGVSTAFSIAFSPKIFKSLFKIKKLRYSILICISKEKERCTLWSNKNKRTPNP